MLAVVDGLWAWLSVRGSRWGWGLSGRSWGACSARRPLATRRGWGSCLQLSGDCECSGGCMLVKVKSRRGKRCTPKTLRATADY